MNRITWISGLLNLGALLLTAFFIGLLVGAVWADYEWIAALREGGYIQ